EDREHRDDRRWDGRRDVRSGADQQAQRTEPGRGDGEAEAGGEPGDAGEPDDEERRAGADEDQAEEIATDGVRSEEKWLPWREGPVRACGAVDEEEDRLVRLDAVPVRGDEQQDPASRLAGEEPGIQPPHFRTVPAVRDGAFIGTISRTRGSPRQAHPREE